MNAEEWKRLDRDGRRLILFRQPGIQSRIARELGVSTATVSLVFWGKATSARVLDAILKAVTP